MNANPETMNANPETANANPETKPGKVRLETGGEFVEFDSAEQFRDVVRKSIRHEAEASLGLAELEVDELSRLCQNSIDSARIFADRVSAVAQAHGLIPSVLRAYIVAWTRDELEKFTAKSQQMDLLAGLEL